MLYGVDIHGRYQAGIDLAALARQGYTFMVCKASEGRSVPSDGVLSADAFKARFLDWVRQAGQLGMVPGLYHWLKAGNGAAQAQFFHKQVTDAGGPGGMLIQLDCEDNAGYADVIAWAAEWRRLTGGHPFLLYTGGWWWKARGWDGNAVTPYLWDSHYLSADADTLPDDPAAFAARIPDAWFKPGYGGWPVAAMLQFTAEGDAGGIGNNVDLNVFRGTREQLLALTGAQPQGDSDMTVVVNQAGNPAVWYGNGDWWKPVRDEAHRIQLEKAFGPMKVVDSFAAIGIPPKAVPPVTITLTDQDRAAIAAAATAGIAEAITAAVTSPAVLGKIAKAVTEEIAS